MKPVEWTTPALEDLDAIQDHIAADNPAAAHRLVNDVLNRTEHLLSHNPMIGRAGRVAGTRELVLPGTAYIVAYRVRESVEILAVMHGAQRWPESFDPQ